MFDTKSHIVRDGSMLSFDYVPETIVCRERQMSMLERFFTPMAEFGTACSAFLYGGVGTGKTVTAKRFCMDAQAYLRRKGRDMRYLYVNCRIRNSEYAVLLALLKQYDPNFPDRGFSADQMMDSLKRHVAKEACPAVVVLDEADVLLGNRGVNLIYQLSRYSEDTMGKGSISIIMISQTSVADRLDEASMSTFRRGNKVPFDRYDERELREIIVSRADLALYPGTLPDDCADMLASLAAEFGDARYAIELLEKSAGQAEFEGNPTIVPDDVRTAGSDVYSNVSESKLVNLDLNHRLVLLAIARRMKGESSITSTEAEKTYHVVCEEYEVPARRHTQYWKYVNDLQKEGLLRTETRRMEDGGRGMFIIIDNIPPRELASKLEYEIETKAIDDETRASE